MRAMISMLVFVAMTTMAFAKPRHANATSEASVPIRGSADDEVDDERTRGARRDEVDDERTRGARRGEVGDAGASGAPGAAGGDGPAVREVIAAAYRAAGLGTHEARGLARRARLAGLVPLLSVRTARGSSWHDVEEDVGRSMTLEVRATWRLDRLMFEPRELQVASLEAARRRERRRLAKQVIRAYYAWLRGARAEEAAAELDELTDGWFGKTVENRGTTSGDRTVDGVPARMP